MTAAPRRLAALDIGTNSVRLLGIEAGPHGPPRTIVDTGQVTRLGAALAATGAVADADLRRTEIAVLECLDAAHRAGITSIEAVGTEVFRAAVNGLAAVGALTRATSVPIRILSEFEEGQAAYLGVVAWPPNPLLAVGEGLVLVVDVGGGSSEITSGLRRTILATQSLPVGALRVTEKWLQRDPPDSGELQSALSDVVQSISAVDPVRFRLPGGGPFRAAAVGGTACAIGAAACQVVPYDPLRVDGATVTRSDLESVLAGWSSVPLAERMSRWGLEEGRARLVIGGALILGAVMERLKLESIEVSTRGIRHGLLVQALAGLPDSD